MRTTRRQLLAGVTAATAMAVPSISHAASAGPLIRWRMPCAVPKTLDVIFGTAEHFARRVSEATAGRFQISVHAAGEIVPGNQVLDAVSAGSVPCGQTASYFHIGKNTALAFDTCMPFGMNARQHNAWMAFGDGHKLLADVFREYGLVHFAGGNSGAQMGGWFRREIQKTADLKGLKIRIGGFAGRIWQALGAVPAQIPPAEIYIALERGTVDAAEWVGPYDDERLGLWKVAQNYYTPGWWDPAAQMSFVINSKAYDALPTDYRAILAAVAAECNGRMLAEYDARNPAAMRRLVGQGVRLRAFSTELMTAFHASTQEVMSDEAGRNPSFRRIMDNWRKFQADQQEWWQVAEGRMDQFRSR
jgi:TRAP-type mannitol/chloroaromatic compound transport system substrate-binding protein